MNPVIDPARAERELLRWYILLTLNNARPEWCAEGIVHRTVQAIPMALTQLDLRRQLDYLEERNLVEIQGRHEQPQWSAKLTRYGIDVVEYTLPCEPGIARPHQY